MNKINKVLKYIIFNATFAIFIYYGLVLDNAGAANVAIFVGWITSLLGLLMLIPDIRETVISDKLEKKTLELSDVPRTFDLVLDISICILFVYYGYFLLSIIYLLHIIGLNLYKDEVEKALAEKNA